LRERRVDPLSFLKKSALRKNHLLSSGAAKQEVHGGGLKREGGSSKTRRK